MVSDLTIMVQRQPVRSTRGALPVFPPVGFPEPPPAPADIDWATLAASGTQTADQMRDKFALVEGHAK